jgi:hypothetical protein
MGRNERVSQGPTKHDDSHHLYTKALQPEIRLPTLFHHQLVPPLRFQNLCDWGSIGGCVSPLPSFSPTQMLTVLEELCRPTWCGAWS